MAKFTILVLLLTVKIIKSIRPEADGTLKTPTDVELLTLGNISIGAPFDEKLAFMEMQSGTYDVKTYLDVIVQNPGSQCRDGYQNKANIYYPKVPKSELTFPVVSHAHAFWVGGERLHTIQGVRLFELIASEGFIVITHQSAKDTLCDTSIDQINMIKHLYDDTKLDATPELKGLVKKEAYVTGWSMGGRATLKSASHAHGNAQNIRDLNIKGAVAIAPNCPCETPAITTFFISGGEDKVSPDAEIFKVYMNMKAAASKKYFGDMGHNPPPEIFVRDIAKHAKNALLCMASKGPCDGYFDATCKACQDKCYQKGCASCGRDSSAPKCANEPCPFCKPCQWGGCKAPDGCTWCNTNV